jgi:KDO2-lipid IV(A) lauroyltransferase
VTRFIHHLRSSAGVRPVLRDNRPLIGAIGDVLQRGDVIGFLIDQDIKVPGVFVPFFGKLAHTP